MPVPMEIQTVVPQAPRIGKELQRLIGLMRKVALLNLYFGLINVCYYILGYSHYASVLITGLVSVCVWWLVVMKIRYINGSKSWVEVSVTVACGLYLPLFTLLLTFLNLVGLIGN